MTTGFTNVLAVESKLFWRDRGSSFFGLFFPAVLLLALGFFFPGFGDPNEDLGGMRPIDIYVPVVLVAGVAAVALTVFPVSLSTYRQDGVLRRLATTPLPPSRLLLAHLTVQVVVALTGGVLGVAAAMALLDVPAPGSWIGFGAMFLLATVSIFSIGLLIGSVAPTTSSGQGFGLLAFFPTMFFAGVYFPREAMPEGLRTVSDFTPAGSAVQAMRDTWDGVAPALPNLLVVIGFTVVAVALAVRLFRWE